MWGFAHTMIVVFIKSSDHVGTCTIVIIGRALISAEHFAAVR